MRMRRQYRVVVLVAVIAALSATRAAADSENVPPGTVAESHIGENVVLLNDVGTGGLVVTSTSDCPGTCGVLGGWGNDVFKLTLTRTSDVTIEVQDCCVVGDAFEILIDCDEFGTTTVDPNHDNDCAIFHSVPNLVAQGTTVHLSPGAYAIRFHDDGGQCTAGCPAGFSVNIAVNPGDGAPDPTCIARVDGLGRPAGQTLPVCPIPKAVPAVSHRGVVAIAAVLSLFGIAGLRRRRAKQVQAR